MPKFNLPTLERYDTVAPQEYWSRWPKNFKVAQKSSINYELFRDLAIDAGFEDRELLEIVSLILNMELELVVLGNFAIQQGLQMQLQLLSSVTESVTRSVNG